MGRFFLAAFLAAFVAACSGQVVSNRDVSKSDAENFDGVIVSYFMPRAEFSVTASYDPAKNLITLAPGDVKLVPDVTKPLHAVYRHDGFSNDEVTIQVDDKGLLKKVSTKTAEQSTAIVKAVGDVAQEFGNLKKAIATFQSDKLNTAQPQDQEKCAAISAKASFDVSYWDYAGRQSKKTDVSKDGSCVLTVSLDVKPTELLPAAGYPSTALKYDEEHQKCPANAVCFRLASGFIATASATLSGIKTPPKPVDDKYSFVAPDRDRMGAVYFNRRAFVTNSTTAEFTNGMLTTISAVDPSEIAAAFSLPVTVLKSLTILVKL